MSSCSNSAACQSDQQRNTLTAVLNGKPRDESLSGPWDWFDSIDLPRDSVFRHTSPSPARGSKQRVSKGVWPVWASPTRIAHECQSRRAAVAGVAKTSRQRLASHLQQHRRHDARVQGQQRLGQELLATGLRSLGTQHLDARRVDQSRNHDCNCRWGEPLSDVLGARRHMRP